MTGQNTIHVVFFKHGDVAVDNEAGLHPQPFNDQNPDGPLELCTCADCGTPSLLNDKQRRRPIGPQRKVYCHQNS